MEVGYIYKIINKVNKKVYIGSTKRPHQRKLEHFRASNKKSLVSLDIQKIGVESFEFIILEEVEMANLLLKEKDYIEKFNTLYPNGYNLHNNSDIIVKNKKHTKRKPTQECLEKAWKSNTGSKRSQYSKNLMSKAKRGISNPHKMKKILAIKNTIEMCFYSINDAAEFFNIKRRSISNVLNGWSKHAGNVNFKYIGENI